MASGDTLVVFTALNNEPPSSNYATVDTRNGAVVLDFDDTTDESAEFSGFMPLHYGGGGVTVTIGWMASDTDIASLKTVRWEVAFKSFSDDADDIDSKSFHTSGGAASTEASASGEVQYADVVFSDQAAIDGTAAAEYFRLKVTRDASEGTLDGDAELLFVSIKET